MTMHLRQLDDKSNFVPPNHNQSEASACFVAKTTLSTCLKAAGFPIPDNGPCVGLSLMAVQEALTNNLIEMQLSIQQLLSLEKVEAASKLKFIKNKRKLADATEQSALDAKWADIYRIAEGISIHATPSEYAHLFSDNESTMTQNAKRTLPLTKKKDAANIVNAAVVAFDFNHDELAEYFSSLILAVPNETIAITVENSFHMLAIIYSPKTNTWSTISSETPMFLTLPQKMLSQTVLSLFSVFSEQEQTTFISRVYLIPSNSNQLDAIKVWQLTQHQKMANKIAAYSSQKKIHLLHIASEGDLALVKSLLNADTNPNSQLNDITPLFIAASKDEPEIAEAILLSNANPNIGCSDGLSPLMIAAENGCTKVVKLLLAHGASPHQPDKHGDYALLIAIEFKKNEIIRLLLPHLSKTQFTLTEIKELKQTIISLKDLAIKAELNQFMDLITSHNHTSTNASSAISNPPPVTSSMHTLFMPHPCVSKSGSGNQTILGKQSPHRDESDLPRAKKARIEKNANNLETGVTKKQ